jgi:hypothetical protein
VERVSLMPIAGINSAAEDAALMRGGDAPRLFVREALNLDITPAGKATVRPRVGLVSETSYRNLWQSPLHGDTFATLNNEWVKLDTATWTHSTLIPVGEGQVFHEVLNNLVCIAATDGLFTYNGRQAQRLTLPTPPPPLIITTPGSLEQGTYGAAVAWLRGVQESAPSAISFAETGAGGGLSITLPLCMDDTVTAARLYLTQQNGAQLLLAGDYPLDSPSIAFPLLPRLGRAAQFCHLSPMPTGKYLKYWRGRLLTAKANVLRWSEAMAYHLHDERHGFIQMPQAITFIQPVDAGIWIGQTDHVVFLEGHDPGNMTLIRKSSKAPVAGSAISVPSDVLGAITEGGLLTAVWLAENGYVAGTATGQLVEFHAGVITGLSAHHGTTVILDRRLLTSVI